MTCFPLPAAIASRWFIRTVVVVVCAATLLQAGCKSTSRDKGGLLGFGLVSRPGGSNQLSRVDPLLTGGRIPPQDLPLPGKEAVASENRDPLYGLPTGAGDRPEPTKQAGRTNTDATPGAIDAALPPPPREPYRPGRNTTAAALAGRLNPRDPTLAIGDQPPPIGTPTNGGSPVRPASGTQSVQDQADVLRQMGAHVALPVREGDVYIARAEVPIDPDHPGRLRAYEGGGRSPEAAMKQLYDQVRGDRRR